MSLQTLTFSSKCGGLCAVGVPLQNGRANHHTFTLPPGRGAQIRRFFGAQPPAPGGGVAAGSLVGSAGVGPGAGMRLNWAVSVPLGVDNNNTYIHT